jgi:biopolymer transport protein ExbD
VQFRRPGKLQVAIEIAPLVDVVFLLVIFFAVSTTFLETSGIKLELPSSTSSAQREAKEIAVYLDADGKLSFDGEVVTLEQLQERLPAALEAATSKVVVLRADTNTPHGQVVRIMDAARTAGADGLTVATRVDAP